MKVTTFAEMRLLSVMGIITQEKVKETLNYDEFAFECLMENEEMNEEDDLLKELIEFYDLKNTILYECKKEFLGIKDRYFSNEL